MTHEVAPKPHVGIVGAGRVGAVLAARLRTAGYPVVAVSGASDASMLRIETLLPGVPVLEPAAVAEQADVLILAVPDDVLAEVAHELPTHIGQFVVHTSGRHGIAVLDDMAARGARPIAMHPAMTFTGTLVDLDRTCVFGVTADDEDRPMAEELATALAGTVAWIPEAERTAYHAALAHGANHLNTLVGQAMDMLRWSGVTDPGSLLRPLLEASLDNTLAYGTAALTGPIARGDVDTVRAHFAALSHNELPTYVALGRATVQRAATAGRINADTAAALVAVFDDVEVASR